MNKSGQYVGVDEKYIPEEEKFVDNTLNGEIKETLRDGVRSVKNYVSKDENKEKIKNTGRKVLKVGKGIAIGYLAYWLIGIIITLIVFITVFTMIFKNMNSMDSRQERIYNKAEKTIDNIIDRSFQE